MAMTGLVRTQYWNLGGPNPTPRTGDSSRAESRTDVEGYLLAVDAARNGALHGWGVAAGLEVSADAGTAGVTVAPGVALDLDGQVLVLGQGGVAVVDPLVGPTGVQNIPTVPVTSAGVVLDTAGLSGDQLLTISWREVEEVSAGLLTLRQAPWLRLVDPVTFNEDGLQLVLAAVTVDPAGTVADLEPGSRRLVGVTAGSLDLTLPGPGQATGLTARQSVSGRLGPRADGGMELSLQSPAGVSRRALSVAGDTGDLRLDAGLRVAAGTELSAGLTVVGDTAMAGNLHATGDLSAASSALAALSVSGDLLVQGTTELGGDVRLGAGLTVHGEMGVKTAPVAGIDLQVNGKICAAVFCNPSDARLKTDVAAIDDVLGRLAAVRAVTFVPVSDEPGGEQRRAGVLAQDVVRVFPELVVPLGPGGLMAVDYAGLAGVLVGAVNELRIATAALASRVADLGRREADLGRREDDLGRREDDRDRRG